MRKIEYSRSLAATSRFSGWGIGLSVATQLAGTMHERYLAAIIVGDFKHIASRYPSSLTAGPRPSRSPTEVNVTHFVKAALEASIVAYPEDPGLSETQLVSVGRTFGLEAGELLDAANTACVDEIEYVGRKYRLNRRGAEFLSDFSRVPQGDIRNPAAFEAVQIFFRDLARKMRAHKAVAERHVVLAAILAKGGIAAEDANAAIAMLVLSNRLSIEATRLRMTPGFERYSLPSEALQSAFKYERAIPPMRDILASVRVAVANNPHDESSALIGSEGPPETDFAATHGSPSMSNPILKQGTDFSASVVFVAITGLRDCTDAPRIPQALSALNAALRDLPSEVLLFSTITGLFVVIPDQASWSVDDTLTALGRAQVGFPLRVGVAHGLLDVVGDVDGETNIVGPAINVAGQIAMAPINNGCLVHETYAHHVEGILSTSDWLHRSQREPLSVTTKTGPAIGCFAAPVSFEAVALESPSRLPFRRAIMLAYNLPTFSAGDRAQLRQRFTGLVDSFDKARTASSLTSKTLLSPSGDGGVIAFLGNTFADIIALADRLRSFATTESLDRNASINVEGHVGLHYGYVAIYTNARGIERPAGRDLFVTYDLANDAAAQRRPGIVVTHILADSLVGGSKQRLDVEFDALEPITMGPAAGVPRYIRRMLASNPADEVGRAATKPATVSSVPRPDIRVNVTIGAPMPPPMDARLRVVFVVAIENHSAADFYFGGIIVFVLDDGTFAQGARDGITGEWFQPRVIAPGDSISHHFSAEVMLQTAASKGRRITQVRIYDKIKRAYDSDPQQMGIALKNARQLIDSI